MARSADMPPRCTPEHAPGGRGNLLPRAPDDASGKDSDEDDASPPLRLRARLRARARQTAAARGSFEQRRTRATRPPAAPRRPARFRGRAVGGDADAPARRGRPPLDPLDDRVRAAALRRARGPPAPLPARGGVRGGQRRRVRAQARRRAGAALPARRPGHAADRPRGRRRDRCAGAGARGALLRGAGGRARRARRARPRSPAHGRAQPAEARGDLPRLLRSAAADPQFPPGKGWASAQATLGAVGADLGKVRIDAEPSPSKAARPLALLVDPPRDVRLSVRPTGGFEEQRAVLHEAARAAGGAATDVPRWELAQLGPGSAAEGVAQLFEELAGDPAWLREQTALRGEPLDDLVHTQATRRLLAARRAAAMVLFEIRRHEGPATAEANASLYRQLLQRATFAGLSDDDAGRWALEADGWLRAATQLQGALLAAQIQQVLEKRPEGAAPAAGSSDGKPAPEAHWWHAAEAGAALRKIWAEGRSGTALDAARALGATELDPAVLAAVANRQLSYNAPEAPPPTQRPDYKYMRGDKKK